MSTTDQITIVVPNPMAFFRKHASIAVFVLGAFVGSVGPSPISAARSLIETVAGWVHRDDDPKPPAPNPTPDPKPSPAPNPNDPVAQARASGAKAGAQYRASLTAPIGKAFTDASASLDQDGATSAGFAASVQSKLATSMKDAIHASSASFGAAMTSQFGPTGETPLDAPTRSRLKAFAIGAASELGK